MAKKFGAGVSAAQASLARKFEQAGLCSYSKAIKAFMNGDNEQIEAWKAQLSKTN